MSSNTKDKNIRPLSKGMESFRATLENIMTHKLEEIEEAAIAKAIRQLLHDEDEQQEQNLH